MVNFRGISAEKMEQNLRSYAGEYDRRLAAKNWGRVPTQEICGTAEWLRKVPITHGIPLEDVPKALEHGVLSYEDRKNMAIDTEKSPIAQAERDNGLSCYVFAYFGRFSEYGSVNLLFADSVINIPGSFYTFYEWYDNHDVLGNPRDFGLYVSNETFERRRRSKLMYDQGMFPLTSLYEMVARMFLHEGENVEKYYVPGANRPTYWYPKFPFVFDPQFIGDKWQEPEIKLSGPVEAKHILGYALKNNGGEAKKERLVSYGIDPERIFILGEEKQFGYPSAQLIDFKKQLIEKGG